MAKSLNVLPDPALKQGVLDCALLEGDKEEWIACCSRRFFPLARRIAREDSLAEDALQMNVTTRLHRAVELLQRRIDARIRPAPPAKK